MDVEDVDLAIIEAPHQYGGAPPGTTQKSGSNGTNPAPSEFERQNVQESLLEEQIAHLEAELEDWQRRTVIWRERAISTKALNKSLEANLEDLRVVLQFLERSNATSAAEPIVESSVHAHSPATIDWWNKVFRRDFWLGPRTSAR